MLDDEEIARADRFRFAADRASFTAAHALLRVMLSEATGLPIGVWRYTAGRFGKPALAPGCGDVRLRFNISHTPGFVACAVAEEEVGIDVEAADRRVDLALADTAFAPEEAALLRSAPAAEQPGLFLRFWTLKEAFIKATGEGLARPLASFSFQLDPVRIRFHHDRHDATRRDHPDRWQFTEMQPEGALVALAVERPVDEPVRFDARAARSDEIGHG